MIKFLESKTLILTPIEKTVVDQGSYPKWINDQQSDEYTQHALFPITHTELEVYANDKAGSQTSIWLGIIHKEDTMHIGNIDISSIDWVNRTGVYNILVGDKNYQGKGIGYEASHLLLNHVFQRLNLNRVQLGVDSRNAQAIGLYNKLGFIKEGKFESAIHQNNVFYDVIRMRLLSHEYKFDQGIL